MPEIITDAKTQQNQETSEETPNSNINSIEALKPFIADLIKNEMRAASKKAAKAAKSGPQEEETETQEEPNSQAGKLEKQLSKMQKQLEKLAAEKAEAELIAKRTKVRSEIQSVISSKVHDYTQEMLTEYIEHRIQYDETGEPVLKIGNEEYDDIKTGVEKYLASNAGSKFLKVQKKGASTIASPLHQQTQTNVPQKLSFEEKARRAVELAANRNS